MGDRFADAEWKLDCLQSRMDSYSEEQEEEIRRKFPKGSKVKENRSGAQTYQVLRVNLPMVVTTGGDFHWSKIVKA